jgi:hypothetical protein
VTRVQAADFPELQRVFSGYLHEDFLEEYATPAAALRAFLDDADDSERRRFAREARRFLERTAPLELDELRTLMAHLGCRWTPPSRAALRAVLAETANLTPEDTAT